MVLNTRVYQILSHINKYIQVHLKKKERTTNIKKYKHLSREHYLVT